MQAMFGLWMSLGWAEIYMDLALWLTEPLVKLELGGPSLMAYALERKCL